MLRLDEKFRAITLEKYRGAIFADKTDSVDHFTINMPGRRRYLFEKSTKIESPWISTGNPTANFIGAYSYINEGGYIRDCVLIGRYCSIGRRVTLGAHMHPMDGVSSSPFLRSETESAYSAEDLERLNIKKRPRSFTIIESDCWIGDGAVLLPGVRIGVGAVIGANSVVTKDVPPYAVVGGAPARHIRDRLPKSVWQTLLVSQWWEYPRNYLESLPNKNVFAFMERFEASKCDPDVWETYAADSDLVAPQHSPEGPDTSHAIARNSFGSGKDTLSSAVEIVSTVTS